MPNLVHLSRPNPAARLLLTILVGGVGAVAVGYVITQGGVPTAGLLIAGPPALLFAGLCFQQPKVGLYSCLVLGFFLFSHSLGALIVKAIGGAFPIGLTLDGCLLIALLGVVLNAGKEGLNRLNSPPVYALSVWMLYNLFELINPEAISREPWFFAVRGLALYWFEVTLVGLVCLKRRTDLNQFIRIWLVGCVVQALWAFKQQYLGLTAEEADWLENVGRKTHLLNGFLRCFSLCADAGQFGAVMAQATLFALIRMLDESQSVKKVGYAGLAALFFWGFALAGSRGPLIVIAGGFAVYLLLRRNIAVLMAGLVVAALAYGFLKFTNIGQGNYQIQRMRSALNPDDPSFQIRKYNQQLFADFVRNKPFGVGLGLAGESGTKYWKNVLTERGIDSWYVKIWVETGVVGLVIHVASLLLFAGLGIRRIWNLRDPTTRSVLSGLLCGYVGIMLASYGNQILGQSPTCFIISISVIFFVNADRFDTVANQPAG